MKWLCDNWELTLSSIGVIVAIIGCIISILNWMQVIDSRRARIVISLKAYNNIFWLVVKNVGYSAAKSILFSVNEDFLEIIDKDNIRRQYDYVSTTPFVLLGGDDKWLYISERNPEIVEKLKQVNIKVSGTYKDSYYFSLCKKQKIDEILVFTEYVTKTASNPQHK